MPGRRFESPGPQWLLLLCLALALPGPASAQGQPDAACEAAQLNAIADHFDGSAAQAVDPVAQACKRWPFDSAITLAAVARSISPEDTAPGERRLHLDVAMLSASGQVLAAHRMPLEEDAQLELSEGGLRLDTARYDLAPGQRAFGVVVTSSARGPSCPDRGFEDELMLFLREGDALRPVLTTYLASWSFEEGSPCSHDAPLVTDSAQTTLHIGKVRHHGLADITLQSAVERELRDANGESRSGGKRVAKRTLQYDGNTYQSDPFEHLFHWREETARD